MKSKAPFLFAADLDGTLLPNTGKPPAPGCLDRTQAFLDALLENDVPICYVTGRHLSLARKGAGTFRLPLPTWWLCNVGTEIYDAQGEPDSEWERRLGRELDPHALRQALSGIPGLSVQEAQKQGRHKFSLYYPKPASERLKAEILHRASALADGLQLIASVEESCGRALLDIIPAQAGKKHAVEYMAHRLGLPKERVFFAGDSGNDLDVLQSGVCGTLVGNTPDEVRDQAMRAQGPESRLFVAGALYGDGVIEGLDHYGFWPLADVKQPADPE